MKLRVKIMKKINSLKKINFYKLKINNKYKMKKRKYKNKAEKI